MGLVPAGREGLDREACVPEATVRLPSGLKRATAVSSEAALGVSNISYHDNLPVRLEGKGPSEIVPRTFKVVRPPWPKEGSRFPAVS